MEELNTALDALDDVRQSMALLLAAAAASGGDPRTALANPILQLSQTQARVDRLKSTVSLASSRLRVLRESVEASKTTLKRSQEAYEKDAFGIEPVAKRQRTEAPSARTSQLPKRLPSVYKPQLDAPAESELDTFLSAAKERFNALEIHQHSQKRLDVTIKGVAKAKLALRQRDDKLEVERLVLCALIEDVELHSTSAYALFRLLSASHSRPGSLEETLARLAALSDLYSRPCSKPSCRKLLSPQPGNEMPVVRVLRAEGAGDASFDAFHRTCWAATG